MFIDPHGNVDTGSDIDSFIYFIVNSNSIADLHLHIYSNTHTHFDIFFLTDAHSDPHSRTHRNAHHLIHRYIHFE
jgi:hypothetical protein